MLSLEATIGVLISAVAVAGASIATYTTIRGTKGPKEHAFVMRSCLLAWLVIALLLTLICCVPQPYNYFLLIPYFIHLPIMTYRFASKQQIIRYAEAMETEREATPER